MPNDGLLSAAAIGWKSKFHIWPKMIGDYIDQCISICGLVLLADTLLRGFRALREYVLYANYYEADQRISQILKRAFSYSLGAQYGVLVLLFGGLVRCGLTSRLPLPPLQYILFIPLYWAYHALNVGHSSLEYAYWVREPHGLDYAQGMASNYFHGYLRLTLPPHDSHRGIRERIELYAAQNNVTFAINRLVILVPNTMFVNSKIESHLLERVKPLETVLRNRAGVERPFKNDVYRFTKRINGTFYYVVMEGATPMLSFFEAMNFQPSATWQMGEMKREILLKFYKHLKKLVNDWPETQQEVEIVLYNAKRNDGRLQDVGEVLLAHLTNLWNEGNVSS